MNLHKWMHHMLWFDCTASPADRHSLVLRRNTVLSVPVIGHRCTVNLPSQKKMEMFIFKYKGCLRFTGQQRNEAENVPAGPLKTPRVFVIHKHWFLTWWCLARGSGGGSDQLYSFYDFRELWRPDICWMTGSCALLFFWLFSVFFLVLSKMKWFIFAGAPSPSLYVEPVTKTPFNHYGCVHARLNP